MPGRAASGDILSGDSSALSWTSARPSPGRLCYRPEVMTGEGAKDERFPDASSGALGAEDPGARRLREAVREIALAIVPTWPPAEPAATTATVEEVLDAAMTWAWNAGLEDGRPRGRMHAEGFGMPPYQAGEKRDG